LGNARRTIAQCVESSLPFFDKFVVFDGSTDGTLDIIRRHVDRIIPQGDLPIDFAQFKNKCLEDIGEGFVWFIHSDEVIESKKEPAIVKSYINQGKFSAYFIPRFNKPDGVDYPDLQANIVQVGYHRFHRKLHEVLVPSPTVSLKGVMIKHLVKTLDELQERDRRWLEIDPETQKLHMQRDIIIQRVRDEYKIARGKDGLLDT